MASGKKRAKSKQSASRAAKKASALQERVEALQERVEDDVGPASPQRVAGLLRVRPGLRLADVDTRSTPGFPGTKSDGAAALAAGADRLSELQERLFADAATG